MTFSRRNAADSGAHVRVLLDGEATAEQTEPAIRRGHQPSRVDVLKRLAEPPRDLVDRLHPAPADVHHAEQNRRPRVPFEETQVVVSMRILERDGINRRIVHRVCDQEVRLWVDLRIVGQVQRARIAAAHVHDTLHVFGYAVEYPFEVFDAVLERLSGLAGEYRLVDLDVAAACRGQITNLRVQRFGQQGYFTLAARR